ncbi:TIGR01777 family oxidoreductase [Flammeovirgaceae bacterium SG7u.111]|nr:TIGR01777 family oxidoreductase [Flammeovirgaceae bacterium SG7u.132]WPO34080.1 TIGR01777 family oxidoreductase [Flammeovirgaceae bacterium SG7u.111]
MQKIVITGGTGFIGLSFAKYLKEKGYSPVLVARSKPKEDFEFAQWDAVTVGDWAKTLEGATAVVNLAGRSVDCIKTPGNADQILRSRVDSTKAVGKAFETLQKPPKVWVQMSTAHIYGDPPTQVCSEGSTHGYGLAPFVGEAWEKTFLEVLPKGVREVRLRTSFVIGKNGGALASLKQIVRLGLGGKAGHGNQGISWLHEDDMNAIMLEAITNESYNGYYISSAPHPVSNKVFMGELRKKMRMPIGLPAPALMVRLGSYLLFKTDPELVLSGRYVKPTRLGKEGFQFKFPTLKEALDDLV